VTYRVAPAESSGLESGSVDLVTVAQALHWFDLPRFYAEVRRVAAPGAVLAAWCYNLFSIDPLLDPVVNRFNFEVVSPYWPSERRLVDEEYRTLPFPFSEIDAPRFTMEELWSLEHMVGYLGTWSAVRRYREATGGDPIETLRPELERAWGDPSATKTVRWPVGMRVGRISPKA
jgi:SAM-dependent methyltransferase